MTIKPKGKVFVCPDQFADDAVTKAASGKTGRGPKTGNYQVPRGGTKGHSRFATGSDGPAVRIKW